MALVDNKVERVECFKVNNLLFESGASAERYNYSIGKIEIGDLVKTKNPLYQNFERRLTIYGYGIVKRIYEHEEYVKLLKLMKVPALWSPFNRVIYFENHDDNKSAVRWGYISDELLERVKI